MCMAVWYAYQTAMHIDKYKYTKKNCIETDYGLDGQGIESRWGPPSLLYNVYRACPGVKVRPGRAADHSPPSTAAVMKE